jgi:hypothetical protein
MQTFKTVGQDELIESLLDHYQHYRELTGLGGSEREYDECREMLMAILEELNYRRKFYKPRDRNPLNRFNDPASRR